MKHQMIVLLFICWKLKDFNDITGDKNATVTTVSKV